MDKILAFLMVIVIAAQAYVLPQGLAPRGLGYSPYNDPLSISGVAGGVANSLSGLGSSLGGLGGPLGGMGVSLTRNLGGVGGPYSPQPASYPSGLIRPGGYGSGGPIAPQGLSLDYGYLG